MRHTTPLARDWIAIHNGDYSGDVTFKDPADPYDGIASQSIPFDIVAELVAEAVRSSAMSDLEDAETAELIPGLDPHMLQGGPEADAARVQADAAQVGREQTRRAEGESVDTAVKMPCSYCTASAAVPPTGGVCSSCRYDTGNVNGRRCVEKLAVRPPGSEDNARCPEPMLGTSQHCVGHQRKHKAVEDESVSEPRCAVCLEPAGYPIHVKAAVDAS